MPQLPKPVFPIQFTLDELKEDIQELLEDNEWEDIQVNYSIEFIPNYFFHYEIFSESVNKETNQKKIDKTQTKKAAINANSGSIEPGLEGFPEKFPVIASDQIQLPNGVHESSKKINLQESEIKGIANLKIASLEGVAKENVIITGIELFYVPYWIAKLELDNEKIELKANAVNGKMAGNEKISERLKTLKELVFETFDDLHDPLEWASNIIDLLKNKYVLALILILAAIWIFLKNIPIKI